MDELTIRIKNIPSRGYKASWDDAIMMAMEETGVVLKATNHIDIDFKDCWHHDKLLNAIAFAITQYSKDNGGITQ